MSKLYSILISLSLLLISGQVSAHSIKGHIAPLTSELLPQTIHLPHCLGVKIIEGKKITNNSQIIQIIDKICSISTANFQTFIEQYNLQLDNEEPFDWNISLLPIDAEYRHLNDVNNRFFYRVKHYLPNGSVVPIYGYTDHKEKILFSMDQAIVNETVNPIFLHVLTHELYHAMSWHFKVYHQLPDDKRAEMEEILAESFVNYIKPWRYF